MPTGTLFSDTHLPLSKWFLALTIMCNAKKSVSAKQMERDMGVSYKAACYLNHRLRAAVTGSAPDLFSGAVEAGATFIGGKFDKRGQRAAYDKQGVFGLVQRSTEDQHSKVETRPIDREAKISVSGIIEERVADTALYTDEHGAYRQYAKGPRKHAIVIHGRGEYVRGDIHNNAVRTAGAC